MRRTVIVAAFSALGFSLAPTALATEHTLCGPNDPFCEPIDPCNEGEGHRGPRHRRLGG